MSRFAGMVLMTLSSKPINPSTPPGSSPLLRIPPRSSGRLLVSRSFSLSRTVVSSPLTPMGRYSVLLTSSAIEFGNGGTQPRSKPSSLSRVNGPPAVIRFSPGTSRLDRFSGSARSIPSRPSSLLTVVMPAPSVMPRRFNAGSRMPLAASRPSRFPSSGARLSGTASKTPRRTFGGRDFKKLSGSIPAALASDIRLMLFMIALRIAAAMA